MTIPAIPALGSIATPSSLAPAAGTGGAAATGTGGAGFTQALDNLQSLQSSSDQQANLLAVGQGNIGDYMVAANEASVATQLTTAVRDKAVASFNEIMGMAL